MRVTSESHRRREYCHNNYIVMGNRGIRTNLVCVAVFRLSGGRQTGYTQKRIFLRSIPLHREWYMVGKIYVQTCMAREEEGNRKYAFVKSVKCAKKHIFVMYNICIYVAILFMANLQTNKSDRDATDYRTIAYAIRKSCASGNNHAITD